MVQRELRNAERNRGLLAGRIMQHLHASLALVQLSTGTANSGRDTQQGGAGGNGPKSRLPSPYREFSTVLFLGSDISSLEAEG